MFLLLMKKYLCPQLCIKEEMAGSNALASKDHASLSNVK